MDAASRNQANDIPRLSRPRLWHPSTPKTAPSSLAATQKPPTSPDRADSRSRAPDPARRPDLLQLNRTVPFLLAAHPGHRRSERRSCPDPGPARRGSRGLWNCHFGLRFKALPPPSGNVPDTVGKARAHLGSATQNLKTATATTQVQRPDASPSAAAAIEVLSIIRLLCS
jgi:hypothetical protein